MSQERRPRLRTVLLGVNLAVLLLPVFAFLTLRMYERELIRHTESELIAQGAVISAAFRAELAVPDDLREIAPLAPALDVAAETVRGPAPDPVAAKGPADPAAAAAGARLAPTLRLTQKITLAAIRVVDPSGTIVASTGADVGMSIAHHVEVAEALGGTPRSVLRERRTDTTRPPLDSPSRRSLVRVFVAIPIHDGDRVVGAVVLSRTPMSLVKALYQQRWMLVLSALVVIGLVVLLSVITSRLVSGPVRRLIEQTRRVAQGDATAMEPIGRPGTAEIAQLSESFAAMARALSNRTEYVRAFASHVSHAFKTPLTSIQGSVELLGDHLDEMSTEERDRFLQIIARDTERMARLVRRLLELARADVAPASGETTPLRPLVERMAARYRADGLSVSTQVAECTVALAAEALESALDNLLDNARRHAGPDAAVRLETGALSPDVELLVSDDGPGIPAARAAEVFEPFVTTARDEGGTGLGLAIVRALLSAHGGAVRLDPVPGAGARFRLSLPRGG